MHRHTESFKRLSCDVCKRKTLTSVAKLDDDEYALSLPPEWRVVFSKLDKTLKFWCEECWETFALTLEQSGDTTT
jgi:hypothetical protein